MRKLLFIFLLSVSSVLTAQNSGITMLRNLNGPPAPADKFVRGISQSAYVVPFVFPAYAFGNGLLHHDRSSYQSGISYCSGFGLAIGTTYVLKKIVERERPFVTYPDLFRKDDVSDFSFPSGHTTTAFATATLLTLQYPKWYVAVPAFSYAVTVGWSRMYLGVHYPGDVLCGALIGSGMAFAGYKLSQLLMNRWNTNHPVQ